MGQTISSAKKKAEEVKRKFERSQAGDAGNSLLSKSPQSTIFPNKKNSDNREQQLLVDRTKKGQYGACS